MLLDHLLDNLGLEVEPFATCSVAHGWRLRLPAGDLVTLHFILRGEGGLAAGHGHVLRLATHALAVVPPGLTHQLEVGTGALAEEPAGATREAGITKLRAGPESEKGLLVACGKIRALWEGRGLFDHLAEPIVVQFTDSAHIQGVFEALLREQSSAAAGRGVMMAALMQQCLVELFRRLCVRDDCALPWLSALEDPRLGRALQAILTAPQSSHSVESLARAAAMSRSAFAARFRAVLRQTPMEFLRDVRLREAARLLRRHDVPIEVVAQRAGFASRSHFTRVFRKRFGQAPAAWRGAAGPDRVEEAARSNFRRDG